MKVAGLTAGAVLAAASVAPDQGSAMTTTDLGGTPPTSAEQQPTRFAGVPDKGAAAIAAVRAAREGARRKQAPKPSAEPARTRAPAPPVRERAASGGARTWTASWYGPGFAGNPTASGEVFRPGALTAAHKTLPFGTRLLVRNPDTGRSVWVRVNDRGPYVGGRDLDLSQGAAEAIGLAGVGEVIVRFAA
jgi:rare lipoprotein A